MVRTSPFHGGSRGSTPLRVAILITLGSKPAAPLHRKIARGILQTGCEGQNAAKLLGLWLFNQGESVINSFLENEGEATIRPAAERQADVYVFALLTEQNKGKVNPLELDQWQF